MNTDYTTVRAYFTKAIAVMFLGSGLCMGNLVAQTAKSTHYGTNPKDKPVTPVKQDDSRWQTGGLFEGFSPDREIIEKRTANAKYFRNADGSMTAQIGRAIHYKDNNGTWQEIDLRPVAGNLKPGYAFGNETNAIKSYFPQQAGPQGVLMGLGNGVEFGWWKNPSLTFTRNGQTLKTFAPNTATGRTQGETLVYDQVYPGVSEEFVLLTEGLENNTIIHQLTPEMGNLPADAMLAFSQFIPLQGGWQVVANGASKTADFTADRFSIRIPGMENEVHFGQVVVFDNGISKNEAMLLLSAPAEKLDAAQKAHLQQSVYTVSYQVRFEQGGLRITAQVPADWLQAASRTFPVTVDPTVTITPTGSTGDLRSPLSHWYGYQRHADLYLQSEVGAYGSITQIEYNCTTGGSGGNRPTKVFMRTTSATTLTGTDSWNSATYTGGAVACLDANTNQGTGTGWKALSLTTPFSYDQNNLLIMVYDAWGGSGSAAYYNISPSITARQSFIRADGSDPGDGAATAVENYLPEIRITYSPLSACAGTPVVGAAVSSAPSVCPTVSFSLSLPTAPSDGGITFQWQSSTDGGGTWSNLGTAQAGAGYTTSLTQATSYRVIVTCTATSGADTSGVVAVGLNSPTGCYCTPVSANCGLDDEIRNVTFGGINNNSTCTAGGYANYSGTVAAGTVIGGLSSPISVTTGPGGNEAIAVWIDYNQNGAFETSEYTYIGNTPGGLVSGTVAIPGTALPGNTRMRVRSFYVVSPADPTAAYPSAADPTCGTISTGFGETEDYAVTITASTTCAGTPVGGTAQASVPSACAASPFTLTLSGGTTQVGITYQWQSSPDGTAWSNLGASQTTSNYAVANQTAATQYRVIVTCTASGAGDTSTVVSVGQNTLAACICTPLLDCTDNDKITNVTFAGINNNSDCGTDGYNNFTSSVAAGNVALSGTYPISVTVSDGWANESVSVWIDYNHNGQFEANEFTYVATGSDEAVTGNISIPGTALTGNAIMRVRVAAVGDVDATDDLACDEDQEYGETEDYLLNITGAVSVDSVVVTTQGNVPAVIATPTGTLQLVATVYPGAAPQSVSWSITPATGTATISAAGLVTGQTAGTVWGKAVSTADASKSDSILITIQPLVIPTVDSVVVTTQGNVPAVIATPTGTLQLVATVYPNTVAQTVTWSITPVTGSATISPSGLVLANSAGTVWGKAVSTVDVTKSDSILITIQPLVVPTVDSVVVSTQGNVPAVIATPTGTLQLVATVYPNTVAQTVTWSIVPGTGTAGISAGGLVTGITAGTVWGKAVSTVDAGKSDSILITIQPLVTPGIDSVVVTTLGGAPASINTPGGTRQLTATVYPTSMSQSVTWSIVPVTGTAGISVGGTVTGQTNGTVWGKAVSTVDPTKADSILITITDQDLGVEELSSADFSAYPNPTSDVVFLKSGKSHGALQVQVMDVTGKVLAVRKVQANELNSGIGIDMTGYASGTYILKIQGENININKRVIRR